jgi:hypothetical protein
VEGNISAAIALKYFDAALGKELRRCNDIVCFRIPAQGNDRGVLQQEQSVPDTPLFPKSNKLFLKSKPGGVVDRAELEDGDHVL